MKSMKFVLFFVLLLITQQFLVFKIIIWTRLAPSYEFAKLAQCEPCFNLFYACASVLNLTPTDIAHNVFSLLDVVLMLIADARNCV